MPALPYNWAMSGELDLPDDAHIGILRLSALGDATHVLPLVRTLQAARPNWRLTWIVGRLEHQLVGDLPGVDFHVFDKGLGTRAYAELWQQWRGHRFDILLQMQVALRASIAGAMLSTRDRLGYDWPRSRNGHSLVIRRRIGGNPRSHVLDGFLAFADALGISEHRLVWDLPLPEDARTFAAEQAPTDMGFLAINPCSSARINNWRNWSAERYAAVAAHAWDQHGLATVLTGGPTEAERAVAGAIEERAQAPVVNLVGQTSVKQLAAVLARARVAIAPDTGPAHIANAVGTPVLGLYATSNPQRTGPYSWRDWCIDRYPEALASETGKTPAEVRWGQRVRDPQAMARITVADVTERLDRLIAHTATDASGDPALMCANGSTPR